MEQEFDVEIKEVLSRVQKVKAESLDDAINKAMDMYYAEQIVLGGEMAYTREDGVKVIPLATLKD